MFRIELEQLNELILEYEYQLEILNQEYQQTKVCCGQLSQSWEGASKEQFVLNADHTLFQFRVFITKMERMKEILKETALPEVNRELNRCEGFSDVLSTYDVIEPSENHNPSGTLYLDNSFIDSIERNSADIGYEETQREQTLWNQAMECIVGGLKFTSLNLNWQAQEFQRSAKKQSDLILQFRESFYHYHQNIDMLEARLSADFEEIAEIQTSDIAGRSYEPLIEQDWSRELIRLGSVIGKMVTDGQDIQLLTVGSGENAVTASLKLSGQEWSKDLNEIGSLIMGVLVEQTKYVNVNSLVFGTFGSNLLMDLLLSTQWGKAKEEELINRYLNKEQYYLGKLTVDIMEEQQSGMILEIADGLIEFIKKNPWISGIFGAGAGGAGMGLTQTTAGTVEVVISEAAAVSAIEIVAAGAVIGTIVVAAAAHNNPKSQELQNENSQKLDEAKENSNAYKTSKSFWKSFYKLPKDIQKQAKEAFEILKKDPNHPGLNFEQLSGNKYYSVRINKKYRAYGRKLGSGGIEWIEINGHDYNEAIKMLESKK